MNVDELAAEIRQLNERITTAQAQVASDSVLRRWLLAQLKLATGLPVRELGYLVDLSGSRVQQILGPAAGQKKSPDQ